jgi:hypothetical protein
MFGRSLVFSAPPSTLGGARGKAESWMIPRVHVRILPDTSRGSTKEYMKHAADNS